MTEVKPTCPFESEDCNITFDKPCPLCGAVGSDEPGVIDMLCARATGGQNKDRLSSKPAQGAE